MKHIITIIALALTSIFTSNVYGQSEFHIMVNKNNSFMEFNEETDIVENHLNEGQKGSLNYFANCLGYSSNETYIPFKQLVCVNMFNKEVIYYCGNNVDLENIPDIEYYLFVSNLKDGIEKHNIRQSIVEKSLGVEAINNIITDETNGFIYEFCDGVLVGYKNINGLNDNANHIKNDYPDIFSAIERNANRIYSSSISINRYIEEQCKYFLNINMNYLRLAYQPDINYNYALLYCIFYSGMSLDDFTFLVPDAYITVSHGNYIAMRYKGHSFIFENNELIK